MSQPITRIALFGALEVTHDRAEPHRPPTQRVLALLGYLIAHHDIPQSRDKLVDLLWPDLMPRQGRRMLSDTLWRARRLLTPPQQEDTTTIAIAGDTVTFRPGTSVWIDLIAFEQLLQARPGAAEPQIEHMRAAVELYRGDLLEECYDDWVLYERERLREQYLSTIQQLLQHDGARGAYDLALQSALRLVRADPLREEAHRALMRFYHLLGRTDDAVRAFEHCRAVLFAELGIEPEPETLSLYEELSALQQRRAGALARPDTPPAAMFQQIPLVGRLEARAEMMEAVEAMLAGAGGMLLVSGDAGQGKSRLLREVASGAEWRGAQVSWGHGREDAETRPFEALHEALLSALTPLRAQQLAEHLPAQTLEALIPLLPELVDRLPGHALRMPDPGDRPAALLHGALTSVLLELGRCAPQVLLLEDLHWFDAATLDALGAALPALRDARVLLILSVRAEVLGQPGPVWDALLRFDRTGLLRRVELRGLAPDEVTELVRRVLRMRHPVPRFSARLAEATGGNPFFVVETLRALYEQGTLTRNAQGTWHTPWDAPETDYHELPLPQGLRQAIDGRVRQLAPAEHAALAAAAVLGQAFSPTTWARIAAAEAPDQPAEIKRLPTAAQGLMQRQFIAEDSSGYRFEHDLLREVVYSRLDTTTRQTLHLRAAEALEHEHYARVEALAQHYYLAGAWAKAVPYLVQAGDHARELCAYREALRSYDQALEALTKLEVSEVDPATHWDIQFKRGAAATPLGEYLGALDAYQAVLRLAAPVENAPTSANDAWRSVRVQALNGICFIYGQRNEYAEAERAIQQALALAAKSPRLIDRAEVCYQAGLIAFRKDDYSESRRLLEEALKLYDAIGLDAARAKCLIRIGWSYMRQEGPTDQVIDYFTQALDIYRRQGDRFNEHLCLGDIAGAHLSRGRLLDALGAVDQCLPFFTSIGALDEIPTYLYTRGEVYRRMGHLEEALEALRESFELCVQLDRQGAAAFTEVAIAAALRDMSRYEEALLIIQRLQTTNDHRTRARALFVAADIWRIHSRLSRAWSCLGEGMALARRMGSKSFQGVAYRLLGQLRAAGLRAQLAAADDEFPDAEMSFTRSLRLLQDAHADDEAGLTYLVYGQYLNAAGRTAEARAALIQAQTIMSRCGMSGAQQQVQQTLGALPVTSSTLLPGQQRVLLARRGVPRGRPLHRDELIEVVWTVDEPAQREVGQASNKATIRQERLLRLCAEAAAQGAEPTVGDLADALGVTPRTVDRDIAALRAAGAQLSTRGANN